MYDYRRASTACSNVERRVHHTTSKAESSPVQSHHNCTVPFCTVFRQRRRSVHQETSRPLTSPSPGRDPLQVSIIRSHHITRSLTSQRWTQSVHQDHMHLARDTRWGARDYIPLLFRQEKVRGSLGRRLRSSSWETHGGCALDACERRDRDGRRISGQSFGAGPVRSLRTGSRRFLLTLDRHLVPD